MMEKVEDAELCFPLLLNSSCRRLRRPHADSVLLFLLLSCISLLTVTLNLLVLVSISHFRQLHTPTNLLLLSLAASDFFVGLLMCFQILLTNGCWLLRDFMCTLYCTVEFVMTSASVGNMVLISVDRYVAICDPLRYHAKVTVRGATRCTCLCWLCSLLYNSVLMKDNLQQPGRYSSCSGQCVSAIDYTAGVADLCLTFVAPVCLIVALYLRVFAVAAAHARAVRPHAALQRVQRSELKAARTLGVVVAVFLACLSPYYCSSLVGRNTLFGVTSVPLETWLFYFNSCLNPVIYAFCYPWFLKSVKLIATFKILQPDSREANVL